MGAFSGLLRSPIAAMAAVAAAAMSAAAPDKLHAKNMPILRSMSHQSCQIQSAVLGNESLPISQSNDASASLFSHASVSTVLSESITGGISFEVTVSPTEGKSLGQHFVSKPLPNGSICDLLPSVACNSSSFTSFACLSKSVFRPPHLHFLLPRHWYCNKHSSPSLASVPTAFMLYKSANLSYGLPNQKHFLSASNPWRDSGFLPPSRYIHTHAWHLPRMGTYTSSNTTDGWSEHRKPAVVVVLLGWLGAKQKHLKRYAEWYTSRGIHAITFTVPMRDVISYRAGGKADRHLDLLVTHLAQWIRENDKDSREKYLIFHTFSNTGWLTYGVILEKFLAWDNSLINKIKGCVVDSAPVATPNPQVWASGFSAALLKKQSVATKGVSKGKEGSAELVGFEKAYLGELKPAVAEVALLVMLENFFRVFLKIPNIDRRLSDVLGLLSNHQPRCPQLYIYSSADRVIPAEFVESFIEQQRKAGHQIRSCNFVSSPHVDHFRTFPDLYSSQLSTFLEDCLHQIRDE